MEVTLSPKGIRAFLMNIGNLGVYVLLTILMTERFNIDDERNDWGLHDDDRL